MTKGPRQARTDELIKLYKENNIYHFYVKGFDGNWQAQNFDTGAAVNVLPRSYAESVQQLSGGSRQALSAKVDPKLQGRLQPRPVRRAVVVSRIPTWMLCLNWEDPSRQEQRGMQRSMASLERETPPNLQQKVEQMYPISKEGREEHELLGHVQYRSWCGHYAAARGVGQQHRQRSEDPVDATVPEIVLDYYFMGEESETAPHIVVKDRKSSAYFSTRLDSKTSQYAVAYVAGAIQELGYKRILFDEERQRASHQTIERKSFGMFIRCGVCTQRSACRRQSRKWFGRECSETGERSIQDTQNFDRGPVQLQN